MGRLYEQLSLEERCEIARLRGSGSSIRQIAPRRLERARTDGCGNAPARPEGGGYADFTDGRSRVVERAGGRLTV